MHKKYWHEAHQIKNRPNQQLKLELHDVGLDKGVEVALEVEEDCPQSVTNHKHPKQRVY